MPRRIEVELTSQGEDGSWTWRAAGARQPKGRLDGGLLYDGAKVGDVVKADAEFEVEGIEIVGVQAPKAEARREPERIELLSSGPSDDQLVTTTLVPKGRGGRGRDDDRRRGRGRRPDGDGGEKGDRPRRERRPRKEGGDREDRPRGERRTRPAPPPLPEKPKPKRLRPLRHHRNAVMESLPEEERPIAEQVLRGGVPAVRQAVDKQNEQAKADGLPTVKAEPLVGIAERLLPQLRTAEWRDRADAALKNLDELDLRDLRSVVVASDSAARDDDTRALANELREGLNRRVEEEHRGWLNEIDETLTAGRVVRALRLSSRPPKAGAPLPGELAARLTEAAGAAFGAEVTQERWATVLDAVAYSPVRQNVTPAAFPESPSDELLGAVRKLASRVPTIAAHFGVQSTERARRPKGAKGAKGPKPKQEDTPEAKQAPAAAPESASDEPTASAPAEDAPVAGESAPSPEAPAEDAPVVGESAPAPVGETPASEAGQAPASEEAPEPAPVEASAVAAEVAESVEESVTAAEQSADEPVTEGDDSGKAAPASEGSSDATAAAESTAPVAEDAQDTDDNT